MRNILCGTRKNRKILSKVEYITDVPTRFQKYALSKKSLFPMVRNDEKITFSEVIIFDGAAENGKNKKDAIER